MINQNILNYYGSKLDAKLDSSEYYDIELAGSHLDYNENLLDFTTGGTITYTGLTFDSTCLTTLSAPLYFVINEQYTGDTCNFLIRRRTELGWTIDMVFNRNGLDWSYGNTFYYLGISGETLSDNYLDNNLSFSFTNDGNIMWSAHHYSGFCHTESGYTASSYITSGQTETLPSGTTLNDFNITITFQRNRLLYDCDIPNDGGWNDLITGTSVTNINEVLTGDTEVVEYIETLNQKWANEQNERLGTLKIYLNGKNIYTLKNWEEIIPSQRESENLLIQKWGGGTEYSGGSHDEGNSVFSISKIRYYEQPLNFIEVSHLYQTTILPHHNISSETVCSDVLISYSDMSLVTEAYDFLITENNDLIIY